MSKGTSGAELLLLTYVELWGPGVPGISFGPIVVEGTPESPGS